MIFSNPDSFSALTLLFVWQKGTQSAEKLLQGRSSVISD